MNKKYGALSSSTNPQELSATVSGAILTFSSIIIMVAGYFNIPLTDGVVANFAEQAGLSVGALWFIFGVIRKVVISIQQKFSQYQ